MAGRGETAARRRLKGRNPPPFGLSTDLHAFFWSEPKKICVGAPVNPMERPGASPKFESHRHRGAVDDSESHPLAHCKASPVAPRHYRRIRGSNNGLLLLSDFDTLTAQRLCHPE
jgi:hypothetical protein